MAIDTLSGINAKIQTIRTEIATGANTQVRVAEVLQNIFDTLNDWKVQTDPPKQLSLNDYNNTDKAKVNKLPIQIFDNNISWLNLDGNLDTGNYFSPSQTNFEAILPGWFITGTGTGYHVIINAGIDDAGNVITFQVVTNQNGVSIIRKHKDSIFSSWVKINANSIADVAGLQAALDNKVDKITGKGLSTEDFTTTYKNKLDTLSEHFKGVYTSFSALTTANPTANAGDYAYVDAGTGSDPQQYTWDTSDNVWKQTGASPTPDATELVKGIAELATNSETQTGTDDATIVTPLKLANWWTNIKTLTQTFTAQIILSVAPRFSSTTGNHYLKVDTNKDLTSVANIPAADVSETSSKRFVTDTEKSTWNEKQDTLVSGTNIKTINNQSILEAGDLKINANVSAYSLNY